SKHLFLRSFSKHAHVREPLKKPLIVGNHRRNASLLQHDFRKPDAIRIFVLPPRQIALELTKPAQQLLAKFREFAPLQHDEAYFRTLRFFAVAMSTTVF